MERFCPLKMQCQHFDRKGNLVKECMWLKHIRGVHPNTGDPVDQKDCSLAWLPVLLMENTREAMHLTNATESYRNEAAKAVTAITQAAKAYQLEKH